MFRNIQRGFTLTELMIVVVIVSILSAFAYPTYTNHMQQVRRSNCQAALLQLASQMERDFSIFGNQYRDVLAAAAFPTTCPIDGAGSATYNLSIPAATLTASTYVLRATPTNPGPQATDPCGTISLTNLLQKGQAAGRTVADCWR